MSQTETFRSSFRSASISFCWRQWAQLGIFAQADHRDEWAIDPEALLIFTLTVARSDPRLFDEVLDWVVLNGRLLSIQRLRNLADDPDDRQLLEATLAWA